MAAKPIKSLELHYTMIQFLITHDIHCTPFSYRQECFTEKYTSRKIHTKLHPGTEWRIFHILTSEDIDDVISRSFTAIRCEQSLKNGE